MNRKIDQANWILLHVPFSSRHEEDQIFLKESFTHGRKMTGMTSGSISQRLKGVHISWTL
jgi:hypothetical protein